MSNDPQRWLESDADPFLSSLLEAGRDDLPDAARMQAIVGKFGSGGGAGGGADPTAAATKTATAASALGKGLAVFAVLGAIGAAVLLGRPREAPVPPPVTAPSVQASAVTPESAPPPPPPPSGALSASSTPSVVAPRVTEDDPEAEALLLRRAQDSLASEPARTLALCREHARRFPRGLLAQEREVLAIDALIRLGRTSDATQRAQAFAAAHPSSPHRRRIDALLGAAVK